MHFFALTIGRGTEYEEIIKCCRGGEYLYDEGDKKLAKLKESYDIAAIVDGYAIVRSENGEGYEKIEVSEMEGK